MTQIIHSIPLCDPTATDTLGRTLAVMLKPGDTLLLDGHIGAGKTHLARALIQSLMSPPEDVPSPTFTIVQTYDTKAGELWHADLYRLSDSSELIELGLTDAFETAICLIEWPDRLGLLEPNNALRLSLEQSLDGLSRIATLSSADAIWTDRLKDLKCQTVTP